MKKLRIIVEQNSIKSSYTHDDTGSILQHTNYHGNGRIITNIHVPEEHRNKGIATKLLNDIKKDADSTKTNLFLEIQDRGGMNKDQLHNWYTKHGFKNIKNSGVYGRKPEL